MLKTQDTNQLMMKDASPQGDLDKIDNDRVYYDEKTWEPLDPKLVREAENEETCRFQKMDVYGYCT